MSEEKVTQTSPDEKPRVLRIKPPKRPDGGGLLAEYVTLHEATEQSGRSVRWWQIRIQRREIDFVQDGGRRLIPIEAVRRMLRAGTVAAVT
jgi:hypothetical protein